jgi:deoxycytidylate deaminase
MHYWRKLVEDLTKYVLGVAAKSNVEKRQVGCILVANGVVVAEGYNDEHTHAEEMACEMLIAEAKYSSKLDGPLIAYVTHQPCPNCAKLMLAHNVQEVKVVEAFMKFDGDKPRFDLVEPAFALLMWGFNWEVEPNEVSLKTALYDYQADHTPVPGRVDHFRRLLGAVLSNYANFYVAEETLAKVLTFGARKYKPGNWKECSDTGRYLAAAHRHTNAMLQGEYEDPETGLPHSAHLLCNLMFLHTLGLK